MSAYRASSRPLARLAPRAPRYRVLWAWCRGVFRARRVPVALRHWRYLERRYGEVTATEMSLRRQFNKIKLERAEYLARRAAWEESGRVGARPVPLPGEPGRISK